MSTQNPTPDATATPRTDANTGKAIAGHYGPSDSTDLYACPGGPFVHADFARTLERELAAAKAEIARLSNLGWFGKYHKAEADNAQLRAQLRERTQWQCACGGTDCAGQAENERLRTEVERLNGVKNQLERTGFQTVTQLADAWLNHQNTFKSQTAYVAEVEARETQLRSRVGKLEAQLTSLADHAEEILGRYLLEKQIQGHPCPQNMVRCTQLQTAIDAARAEKGAT